MTLINNRIDAKSYYIYLILFGIHIVTHIFPHCKHKIKIHNILPVNILIVTGQVLHMENRRYGRASTKYRAKIEKKKTPLEKILARQSAVCAVLMTAGIAASFLGTGKDIHSAVKYTLYNTNSASEWKKQLKPAADKIKTSALSAAKTWDGAVKTCEKRLGITKPQTSQPAKADSKKTAEKDKKTEKSQKSKKAENTENDVTDANSEKSGAPNSDGIPVFAVPTYGEISSAFGTRVHPISGETLEHTGIDIAADGGACVVAAAGGTVEKTGEDSANGKYIIVRHSANCTTVYAHLSKVCVTEGEAVDSSIKIGEVGSSGISTGPHLHFEIKINQKSVNPENYVNISHRTK